MKISKSKQVLGVLALLGSSVASAVTVNVTPSAANPIPIGTFTITVSSPDMPVVTGTTLGLQYDTSRISFASVAPILPFNDFTYLANAGPAACAAGLACDGIVIINTGVSVGGPFSAFSVTFNVLNNALNQTSAGAGSVLLVDDGADFGWSLAAGGTVQGVVYNQANVTVGTAGVVPAPATAWLLATALGFVGVKGVKARRRAS